MSQTTNQFTDAPTLPSKYQPRDFVSVDLGESGNIKDCRVEAVNFEEDKVYYDLSVRCAKGYFTELQHVDSAFVVDHGSMFVGFVQPNKKETAQELVLRSLLDMFPTEAIEKHMAPESELREVLKLSEKDITYLAGRIDNELRNRGSRHLTDEQIASWITVADVIASVDKNLLIRSTF